MTYISRAAAIDAYMSRRYGGSDEVLAAINALPASGNGVDVNGLNALQQACSDMLGYLSDNSCSDPDCCGGPFYERSDFYRGEKVLKSFGLQYVHVLPQ